jgi:class 3 adenylate cyclase/CHASE2 domain-containing sensor protein
VKFPFKLRRLKKIGIALTLSALASAVGVTLYALPKNTLPSANRIADFVFLNDALFWARDQKIFTTLHIELPDLDEENPNLRLLALDENSLLPREQGGFGAWPWPRHIWGDILKKIHRAGGKIAAFDVIFPDPAQDPKQDAAFIAGLEQQPTILSYTLNTTSAGNLGVENLAPNLAQHTADIGYTTVDNPGGWLVGQFLSISATDDKNQTTQYVSMAGATSQYFTGQKIQGIDAWNARIGNTTIPLDGEGYLLMLPFKTVEFQQQEGRVGATQETMAFAQTLGIGDAFKLSDNDLRQFVGGKVVVIGTTAQAMGDFILTPNGRFPGVFSNLRFMDQLLTHKFIARVPPWFDIMLIIVLPLLIGFVMTQLQEGIGIGITIAAVVIYSFIALSVYGITLHWMDLIHVDGGMLAAALFVALYRVITEGADKRAIRDMFGKHVSPEIVSQMLNSDDPKGALDLSGKRVKVTIFYSDIRGFTAMSEKMTPEQIYGQLNEYFEDMCSIVFKYGGYVDKFIGDCLMAVFSAPNPTEDDALKATTAALEQQEKIAQIAAEWAAMGKQTFTVGMGLNTGEVVMGNLGSSERMNYTVIGDNVNTAARLYNVAKGGQIIISESTYNEVKDHFIVRELQPVQVKGKVLPLRNFEILARLEPGQPNTSEILDQSVVHEPAIAADH